MHRDGTENLHQPKGSATSAALLKQIKGVGTLIALTFLLTLEAHRLRKSRDVGCYLELQPVEETPVRASRR